MKILDWIYIFLMICFTSLPCPSIAEHLTSSSSPEASSSISSSAEPIQVAVAMEPPEPLGETEPLESFHPVELSFSTDPEDEPIQAPVANIPLQSSESEEPVETLADPLEPVNRAFFHVNDKLYFWFFKPVATGYKAIIPEDGRLVVQNFFSNLTTPIRLVNCLLQAKFKGAGNETVRFLVNTTLGIAGLLDPAKKDFEIEKQEADFGQTLGIWGIGPAFYIDWPILGPSSLRDSVGYVGDVFLDPRTYLLNRMLIADISVWLLDKVNETSLTIGEYESLKKAALDPYIALREAYHQIREHKIRER